MVCTYCTSQTDVVNSRHQRRANNVWRRRHCQDCNAVFTTIEQVDYEKSWVVSGANGASSPFLRDKLFISLYKSLGHRPTATNDAIGLTATAISKLQRSLASGSISTETISAVAHQTLQRFDKAAATTYLAYHQ